MKKIAVSDADFPPLSARLKNSYQWYLEHPEDVGKVSGQRFLEILETEYPVVYEQFMRTMNERKS